MKERNAVLISVSSKHGSRDRLLSKLSVNYWLLAVKMTKVRAETNNTFSLFMTD